jgi:hypothetical protein
VPARGLIGEAWGTVIRSTSEAQGTSGGTGEAGEYTRRSSESGRASGESEAREDTRRSSKSWGTSSDSSFVRRLRVIDPSSLSVIRVLDRRVIGH